MEQIERRLISEPHRVHWCGFTSNTRDMQQSGWRISVQQDFRHDHIRLAFRHDGAQCSMLTDTISYYHMIERHVHTYSRTHTIDGLLDFYVVRAGYDIQVTSYREDKPRPWFAVDALPQMNQTRMQSLEDFAVFAKAPLTRTQELIVDPNDVNELMSRIIDLQKPEQDRLRQKARLRESREGMILGTEPKQTFHAQILSIAA